jgi:hypothetical protein
MTYFDEDGLEAPVAYVEIHLAKLPLWKRLRYALAYVLGRQSDTGAFEEIVLDSGTALELGDLLLERTGRTYWDWPQSDVY